jgi:hypothetical protein
MRELESVSSKLFVDFSSEFDVARAVWQSIATDDSFLPMVSDATYNLPLPLWNGILGDHIIVDPHKVPMRTLVGVDGSQIYPDRHQGSSCFLINIGSIILSYGITRPVKFSSDPQVFVGDDDAYSHGSLVDYINCRREELEFDAGLALMNTIKPAAAPGEQQLLLFDGALIFWHLESKDFAEREIFLSRYCASLVRLHDNNHLCAGYISCPRNKDLVNLLRFAMASRVCNNAQEPLDHILDVHVAEFFLPLHSRTLVFKHQSKLCDRYQAHVRPYFFYLNVGSEIARIEVPAWIALNDGYVDTIASMILDSSIKGRGYPVVLAEAHEQAVVKGPDRELFYHLIQKIGLQRKQILSMSQKNVKKRGIGV